MLVLYSSSLQYRPVFSMFNEYNLTIIFFYQHSAVMCIVSNRDKRNINLLHFSAHKNYFKEAMIQIRQQDFQI